MCLESSDAESQDFAELLLDVGHGNNCTDGHVALPADMITHDLSSLINNIYAGIDSQNIPPPEYFKNQTIFAARNGDVDDINMDILQKMCGNKRTYFSADEVHQPKDTEDNDQAEAFPVEFLHSLNASGLPPGELTLKIGCPLILLQNLTPQDGLCNGTHMVLIQMSDRVLEVHILGGDHDGKTMMGRWPLFQESHSYHQLKMQTSHLSSNTINFQFVLHSR